MEVNVNKICLACLFDNDIIFTCDGVWDSFEENQDPELQIGVYNSKEKRNFTFNKILVTCMKCKDF